MLTDLESLSPGTEAVVVRVDGGRGVNGRLDALGLRPGKSVRKISTQFMSGPIMVVVGGRQVAMGRGIARKIQVETSD